MYFKPRQAVNTIEPSRAVDASQNIHGPGAGKGGILLTPAQVLRLDAV
jgi:hypothetical protein